MESTDARTFGDYSRHSSMQMHKEAEVASAEMENRLRQMILEVLRPTISRTGSLHASQKDIGERFEVLNGKMDGIIRVQQEWKDQWEIIGAFKNDLSSFWDNMQLVESRIAKTEKGFTLRLDETETALNMHKSNLERLSRAQERVTGEVERFQDQMKNMGSTLEKTISRHRGILETEVKRIDKNCQGMQEAHTLFVAEVWGDQEQAMEASAPPSIRRLDHQMQRIQLEVREHKEDIHGLRTLGQDVMDVQQRQKAVELSVDKLTTLCSAVQSRLATLADDTKKEFAHASNTMTAYSATLLREARGNFKDELQAAQQMRHDVEEFVRQTQASLKDLTDGIQSAGKQSEAVMRELRIDLEAVDDQRRRDKQGMDGDFGGLQSGMQTALFSATATLKGLEHMSNVMGMALQSERISVALEQQEYVERKGTVYVGVKEEPGDNLFRHRKPCLGISPEQLMKLSYDPQPVLYQGSSFQRQQLLAIREQLVHMAQEVLLKGPTPDGKDGPSKPASRLGAKSVSPNPGQADQRRAGSRLGKRFKPLSDGAPSQSRPHSVDPRFTTAPLGVFNSFGPERSGAGSAPMNAAGPTAFCMSPEDAAERVCSAPPMQLPFLSEPGSARQPQPPVSARRAACGRPGSVLGIQERQ